MTADEMFETLEPSPDNAMRVAEAYLQEQGDIPPFIAYQLGLQQESIVDQGEVWQMLQDLREAHFAELGEPVPESDELLI